MGDARDNAKKKKADEKRGGKPAKAAAPKADAKAAAPKTDAKPPKK